MHRSRASARPGSVFLPLPVPARRGFGRNTDRKPIALRGLSPRRDFRGDFLPPNLVATFLPRIEPSPNLVATFLPRTEPSTNLVATFLPRIEPSTNLVATFLPRIDPSTNLPSIAPPGAPPSPASPSPRVVPKPSRRAVGTADPPDERCSTLGLGAGGPGATPATSTRPSALHAAPGAGSAAGRSNEQAPCPNAEAARIPDAAPPNEQASCPNAEPARAPRRSALE
jgi:hypothetical protein